MNVRADDKFGQFVFPKAVLIEKGVITSLRKDGKRAIRVYPIWDVTQSKQAERTQKWQLNYFYEIREEINFEKVKSLYSF